MNDLKLYEKLPLEEYPINLSVKDGSVRFTAHWHEHTEIHFVKRGNLSMTWNSRSHTLSEYDCAIVNANELHEGAGYDCDDLVIMIHPSFFDGNYVIFSHLVNDDNISDLIIKIFDEYKKNENVSKLLIKGYTYQLIAYLCKNHSVAQMSEENYRAFSQKYKMVNSITQYINNNYFENITTKFLAEKAHVSQSHFCHVFKDVMGESAKEYLVKVRVKKAADMLKSTDMNITEIAYSCGFSDANYFSRAFKKFIGTSPTIYKSGKEDLL